MNRTPPMANNWNDTVKQFFFLEKKSARFFLCPVYIPSTKLELKMDLNATRGGGRRLSPSADGTLMQPLAQFNFV